VIYQTGQGSSKPVLSSTDLPHSWVPTSHPYTTRLSAWLWPHRSAMHASADLSHSQALISHPRAARPSAPHRYLTLPGTCLSPARRTPWPHRSCTYHKDPRLTACLGLLFAPPGGREGGVCCLGQALTIGLLGL